jgi:alcohol dehydrogenase (cytochrome c)
MPPGGVTLPGNSYLELAAFILDANSAQAGNQALTSASNVSIRSVASGQRASYLQNGGGPAVAQTKQGNTKQGKQANQEKQAPRGITVAGEVKNYVPVTDAMLLHPDPADWLMIRRDYKANSFSPLNQITTQNVTELRPVWSWAMQDGVMLGNQPAPIVHNGVLYINNTGGVLQALDAKTGDLIWENRYGTNPGWPAMRGITIYGDNVYVTTNEAHLMAFNARNGSVVWDTTIGDRSKAQHSAS